MEQKKTIRNAANERLCVETFLPESVKGSIVFCHGITGCRKGRSMEDNYFQVLARRLMDLGYKTILFDFSGHGESEGNDFDVSLSKSTDELRRVFASEVTDPAGVKFLAFSYGATVLGNFLKDEPSVDPSKIVLYSPCFYPLESCFLSTKSIFGKDIVKAVDSGDMEKNGFAVVGAKNFRFGARMLEECQSFSAEIYKTLSGRTVVFGGKQDVILETAYNDKFCSENGITLKYFDTSHSLYEDIENVFDATIAFFES